MGITVRESLRIGGLQRATLLGGEGGLNNIIEYVSFAETPDVGQWLKGNEMMISSFYSMKQHLDQQLKVLDNMHNAGSAALVIPYPEIRGFVAQEMIDKANEYCIPLLSIPQDVYYLDVIMPVARAINQQRMEQLEFSNNLYAVFSKIVLDNKDLYYFSRNLYQLIQTPVIFLSSELKTAASAGCDGNISLLLNHDEIFETLKTNPLLQCRANYQDKTYNAWLFPVRIDNWVEAILCILSQDDRLPEQTRLAGEQAAIIFGWYVLKDKSVKDAMNNANREFIDLILYNHSITEDSLLIRTQSLGLNPHNDYCVIIIDPCVEEGKSANHNTAYQRRLTNAVEECLLFGMMNCLFVSYGDKHVILYALPAGNNSQPAYLGIKQKVSRFFDRLQNVDTLPAVGIGRIYTTFSELKLSYKEASTAIELSHRGLWPVQREAIFIDNIEEYAFLYDTRDQAPRYLKRTINDLRRLAQYDEENNTQFFDTLKALFLAEQNTDKAAAALYVHRNTILYRKEKLKSVMAQDPFADENRFRFELAMKFYSVNPSILDKEPP